MRFSIREDCSGYTCSLFRSYDNWKHAIQGVITELSEERLSTVIAATITTANTIKEKVTFKEE